MLPGLKGFEGLDRLDIRLVALLGIALLPIGLIAMIQTWRVIEEANAKAEQALLVRTSDAAQIERQGLQRARGSATVLASLIPALSDDPAACSAMLVDYVSRAELLSYAGFVNNDRVIVCASAGVGTKLSDRRVFDRYEEARESFVMSKFDPEISPRAVIVLGEPVTIEGEVAGYVGVSVPHDELRLGAGGDDVVSDGTIDTVTFNEEGEVLTSHHAVDGVPARLPVNRSLKTLTGQRPVMFHDVMSSGNDAIFTVAPLLAGSVSVMSIWPPDAASTARLTAASAILFPVAMWLVSLSVAYFAVHRLVTRHIRALRQRIRAFSATRSIVEPVKDRDTPTELREVIETFHQMTVRIVRDEADLENHLHEKDVLLREVHHRVKNNLQLITSMTNMQLRKTSNPETQFALKRLQDRVLGLAAIHRNLYQASILSKVDAKPLICDLVAHVVAGPAQHDIELTLDIAHVELYPDQAVPLSLLVTEATTNALKFIGKPAAGPNERRKPWIDISLERGDDCNVIMRVANSKGTLVNPDAAGRATGLGDELIHAFVMQLDATSRIGSEGDAYVIEVEFEPSKFSAESG